MIGIIASRSSNKQQSENRKRVTWSDYERAGIRLPDEQKRENDPFLTEEIYFDVVDIDRRSKKARRIAGELTDGDALELEIEFKRKTDFEIKVYADYEWIGYVEDAYKQEIYDLLLHGNDNYRCTVYSVNPYWDSDVTDAGNFVEFVSDVDLTAYLRYEKFEIPAPKVSEVVEQVIYDSETEKLKKTLFMKSIWQSIKITRRKN